jgi:hypothetical protein
METKRKEELRDLAVLEMLFNTGQITVDEFLTFAPLSFAPELLKMIKNRRDNFYYPPAESSVRGMGNKN